MNIDLIPNGAIKRVHVSQNDVGRTLTFELFNNSTSYTVPSGAVVKIQGTKPSGFGFSETCTVSGNVATIDTTEAMTDESGNIQTELSISYGDVVIGTSNFVLAVEKNPHPSNTTDGTQITAQSLQVQINELRDEIDLFDDLLGCGEITKDEVIENTSIVYDRYIGGGGRINSAGSDVYAIAYYPVKADKTYKIAGTASTGGSGQGLVCFDDEYKSDIGLVFDSVLQKSTNTPTEYDITHTPEQDGYIIMPYIKANHLVITLTKETDFVRIYDIEKDIETIQNEIESGGSGLTDGAKQALLNCFAHVAWIDEHGQDYYDALESALYPPTNLSSISATYTQSGTVYEETSTLNDLRTDLVVTAHYSDNTSETINAYSLSGTLTLGTSTITVSYGGKTTTFNVTVTTSADYYWDFTSSLTDIVGNVMATLNNCSFTQGTGVLFDNNNAYIDLGSNRFGLNKTIIIDIADATASFGNTSSILLEFADANTHDYPYKVDPTVTYDGRVCFGYHYSSTAANNRFGVISKVVDHWGYSSASTKTAFNGSHELKLTVDANGLITVYKDGEDINVLYNNAQTYTTVDYLLYTVIGSISYYATFYNATIERVRIYSGMI